MEKRVDFGKHKPVLERQVLVSGGHGADGRNNEVAGDSMKCQGLAEKGAAGGLRYGEGVIKDREEASLPTCCCCC